MRVCSTIYGSNQKDFWPFYMYLKVIVITLSVHVLYLLCFSLFLNMFCVEKKVSEFFATHSRLAKIFATHLTTRQLRNWKNAFFATHSRLVKIFTTHLATHQSWNSQVTSSSRSFRDSLVTHKNLRDSPSRETPKNSFLKGFLWETCFKPLPSSLKPLFQFCFIKTQPIWMVCHSINISKIFLKSFHWFRSLDYVLESFVLLVGIFIIGVGKTYFCQIFVWDWFLFLICFGCWPIVAKRTCIKGGFHHIHALFHIVVHSVHARCLIKCLLGIFSLVWTPISTKLLGFLMFFH